MLCIRPAVCIRNEIICIRPAVCRHTEAMHTAGLIPNTNHNPAVRQVLQFTAVLMAIVLNHPFCFSTVRESNFANT